MKPEAILFSAGAGVALVLLARHALRTMGPRDGLAFFGLLALFSLFRETYAVYSRLFSGKALVYIPDPSMVHLGGVHLTVVGGWVFTAYLCFNLARMIRARSFPGANALFVLGLAGILTTTVSFAVEATGMAADLWSWAAYHKSNAKFWLPFGYHNTALRGWMLTVFFVMVSAALVRSRVFSPRLAVRAAVVAAFAVITEIASRKPHGLARASYFWLTLLVPAVTLLGFWAHARLRDDGDRLFHPEGGGAAPDPSDR